MRAFVIFFAISILLSGCAQQPVTVTEDKECQGELKEVLADNENLQLRISELVEENQKMKRQLDDYYFTQITSDVDLVDWNAEEIIRGLTLYTPQFDGGAWWTYFYHLDTKNYYYQQGGVFAEDPFFQLRYKNSGQEFSVSRLRVINIALGNRTSGQEKWKEYVVKILKETQVDANLTCYQQTACRQVEVIKCNSKNQKLYVWSEGTNLFMARNDEGVAVDTFLRFYCTQQ